MSFVRFGQDDSSVYIIETKNADGDLVKECCGCSLNKRLPDRTDAELAEVWVPAGMSREFFRQRWEPDFTTDDLDAMLGHLAEHRTNGHVIPGWLDRELADRWTKETTP